MTYSKSLFKFDSRCADRNIKHGVITPAEVQKHLDSLPDVAEKGITLGTVEDERLATLQEYVAPKASIAEAPSEMETALPTDFRDSMVDSAPVAAAPVVAAAPMVDSAPVAAAPVVDPAPMAAAAPVVDPAPVVAAPEAPAISGSEDAPVDVPTISPSSSESVIS